VINCLVLSQIANSLEKQRDPILQFSVLLT